MGTFLMLYLCNVEQLKQYIMDLESLTIAELIKMEQEIFDEWDKSGNVHSLGDYSEIIRELTKRELDN